MAMLPFTGYNMADYFRHWLQMGKKLKNPPKIFSVNWFRKGEAGEFLWPGFRENSRVIKWIIDRIKGKAGAKETPIGLIPRPEDLCLEGLDIDRRSLERLLEVRPEEWKREVMEAESFYEQFGDRLPGELRAHLERLKKAL
jgi:phosphoenolpyruvate carboxykinase (GTP)